MQWSRTNGEEKLMGTKPVKTVSTGSYQHPVCYLTTLTEL